MKSDNQKHEGHYIELRKGDGNTKLFIDNVPIRYGHMHNGMYFLHDYAYDHTDSLMDLARKYVDYRNKVEQIRHDCNTHKGRK